MKTKSFKLNINIPVSPKLNSKNTFYMKSSVRGMMQDILVQMSRPEIIKRDGAKYWIEEYINLWLMDKVGIKYYPLVEK